MRLLRASAAYRSLWPASARERWLLLAILVAALALRLAVWRWHMLYPLGGDESEYFNQALAWLRGEGYHDLPLMRPPLYPVFLAGVFQLFDSQVQRVRLVQALISTGTVYMQWLLARLALQAEGAAPLIAAALAGLSYTLAANATELLAETTFLFGFSLVLCLLLKAGQPKRAAGSRQQAAGGRDESPASVSIHNPNMWFAAVAGIGTGLLALQRSVALPLLPLGSLWLLLRSKDISDGVRCANLTQPLMTRLGSQSKIGRPLGVPKSKIVASALLFLLAGMATIAPWTARNYLQYGQPIIVDTTGAENLWLDNDPAGREAVKRALYALGDDRGARQSLSLERGRRAILDDPARFARKVGAEAQKLVALEYWDDMRSRPAIWVPPLEVWLRVLLGDGVWLLLAILGSAGLWLLPDRRLQWLLGVWVVYVVATNLIFHVELRYRLPLYPVLGLGAAALLAGVGRVQVRTSPFRVAGGTATIVLILGLMLLHRPYISEGVMLAAKHWQLWRGDGAGALQADPVSALARVLMARDELRLCGTRTDACRRAEELLRDAIEVKSAPPYAHLLLGGLLRQRGAVEEARAEFRYETASLEDLQRWTVLTFGPRGERRIDIGDGLDLGDIEGFYPASDGYRWTTHRATTWLHNPQTPATLRLRLASGRPATIGGSVIVRLSTAGTELGQLMVGPEWATYEVQLPANLPGSVRTFPAAPLAVMIESPTFRPRDLERANNDNRPLGIKVDWVEVVWERRT